MDSIRVVVVEARPRPDSPESVEVAGAFVNVYSTAASEDEALRLASTEISEAGWQILAVDDSFCLSREEAVERPDCLPYFEQALIDGVALVFHTYPHGGEESDVLH